MEKTLKTLFDYQKFERNADLQKIIDSTHAKYGIRQLDLDELEFVSAAGVPQIPLEKSSDKDRS